MVLLAPILFLGWKFTKGTKFVRPEEADLLWEKPMIDAYEDAYIEKPGGRFMKMLSYVGLAKLPPKETTV